MPISLKQCENHAEELGVIITHDAGEFSLYFIDETHVMPPPLSRANSLIALCGNLVAIEICYGPAL